MGLVNLNRLTIEEKKQITPKANKKLIVNNKHVITMKKKLKQTIIFAAIVQDT